MQLFSSIFQTTASSLTLSQLVWSLGVSLLLGVLLALVYQQGSQISREFVVALALLPTLIGVMIFLINGNLGTSVAVAGAFSLIRFRSAAGSSRELLAVFLATAIGLATGMGYLLFAAVFTLVILAAMVCYEKGLQVWPSYQDRYVSMKVEKEVDYEQVFSSFLGMSCRKAQLLSVHYKQKSDSLVLEYLLRTDKKVTDKEIMNGLLAQGIKNVTCTYQVPKKKYL